MSPKNYLLHACGVRRGLAYSKNHLRHFYEQSQHAEKTTKHMLAHGLHRVHHHMTHHLHGRGGNARKKLEDYERPSDGEGLKHRRSRPSPLHFKF